MTHSTDDCEQAIGGKLRYVQNGQVRHAHMWEK